MTENSPADERTWTADKRDFVADRRDDVASDRDEIADAREDVADQRDRIADEREAALDEWQRLLEDRAAALGLPPDREAGARDRAASLQVKARLEREEQRHERDDRRREREDAISALANATNRRHTTAPQTGLAMAFAEISGYLYQADSIDEVLLRIAATAVSTVSGCDFATVTVRDQGAFKTIASTGASGDAFDRAQRGTGQGPSVDALDAPLVHVPEFPDERWPTLGSRALDCGVRSAISYRLAASGGSNDGSIVGSLNCYAPTANAFDDEARETGLILAAHASVAVWAVSERTALEKLGRQLHEALSSRDVIGQAKGILMERLRVTPEEAFDVLRRSSQRLNLKLRELAERVAQTGEFPGGASSGRH
jgi:ANTAR domain/GAF domain